MNSIEVHVHVFFKKSSQGVWVWVWSMGGVRVQGMCPHEFY